MGAHEVGVTGIFQQFQRQLSQETEGSGDGEATTWVSGCKTSPLSFESTVTHLQQDGLVGGSLSSCLSVGGDPLLPLFRPQDSFSPVPLEVPIHEDTDKPVLRSPLRARCTGLNHAILERACHLSPLARLITHRLCRRMQTKANTCDTHEGQELRTGHRGGGRLVGKRALSIWLPQGSQHGSAWALLSGEFSC